MNQSGSEDGRKTEEEEMGGEVDNTSLKGEREESSRVGCPMKEGGGRREGLTMAGE